MAALGLAMTYDKTRSALESQSQDVGIGATGSGTPAVNRIRNFTTTRLPIVLYCLVGLGFLVQGIRYLGATELMPYHSAVIETPWESLTTNYQTLFLGLLKGFGAGSIGVGLAIMLLALIPLRAGSSWARCSSLSSSQRFAHYSVPIRARTDQLGRSPSGAGSRAPDVQFGFTNFSRNRSLSPIAR